MFDFSESPVHFRSFGGLYLGAISLAPLEKVGRRLMRPASFWHLIH